MSWGPHEYDFLSKSCTEVRFVSARRGYGCRRLFGRAAGLSRDPRGVLAPVVAASKGLHSASGGDVEHPTIQYRIQNIQYKLYSDMYDQGPDVMFCCCPILLAPRVSGPHIFVFASRAGRADGEPGRSFRPGTGWCSYFCSRPAVLDAHSLALGLGRDASQAGWCLLLLCPADPGESITKNIRSTTSGLK